MLDQYERKIDYMRISVTDRCNLRCLYCMPEEGIECVSHEEILTFEEITCVVEAMAALGIEKIKITGGEPLVRKKIVALIGQIKKIPGIKQVTLTTNGVLLAGMAQDLWDAGLDGINISLDTLDRAKYQRITRQDQLLSVLAGIEKALALGFHTKINCVPIKDFNEDEFVAIAAYAKERKVEVRFIEMMPIGLGKTFELIPFEAVKEHLETVYGQGEPSSAKYGNGPARYYDFQGFAGSIGFISAVTHEFCGDCNRIRMTAEGELKLCLYHTQVISLKPLLRNHITTEELKRTLQETIYTKPNQHGFNQSVEGEVDNRSMFQIGG